MDKDFSRPKLAIFASYIKPHGRAFAIDMALSLGIAVVDLVFAYVSRWSMRTLLPEGLFKTFFTVMLILFAAYMVRAAGSPSTGRTSARSRRRASERTSASSSRTSSCSRGR